MSDKVKGCIVVGHPHHTEVGWHDDGTYWLCKVVAVDIHKGEITVASEDNACSCYWSPQELLDAMQGPPDSWTCGQGIVQSADVPDEYMEDFKIAVLTDKINQRRYESEGNK